MSIILSSNFTENAQLPLDSRTVVADLMARDAIPAIQRYDGLTVYVTAEQTTYQLIGGIENTDWVEFGAGGAETDPLSIHKDGSSTTSEVIPFTYGVDIDYNGEPTPPSTGQMIYDVLTSKLKRYNGATWDDVGGGGDTGATGSSDETHGITVDNGIQVVTTGLKGFFVVPFSGTITRWDIVASQAGSIVFDIWKANNSIPTIANTITASAKPTLSSAQKGGSSTLTGWTTTVTAGDIIGYNIDSVTDIKRVTLIITIAK